MYQHLILEQLLKASLLKAQQEATKQGLAYYGNYNIHIIPTCIELVGWVGDLSTL